ncbi:MAG: hypothetical protein KAS99_00750 [Candidatus Omnitrophica bacterium]|nr:hypothetical protein [Candidatus Omnitrophota bacterium]
MEELKLTEEEVREGAGFAALSYVFFLWFLTFLFKKNNGFAHYHAKQGLVISLGEIILAFFSFLPLIYPIGVILFLIVSLYGIYSALTGKLCKIAIVSKIAAKIVI